jgi:hypothetical protein
MGKKRAAPASATPSRDEKKQDIGSPSSSSPMDTTVPLHTPLFMRKNDDREFEGVSEEPESKKIDEGKCSCSGCKSSSYVSISFLIASGPALPSNPEDLKKRLNLIEKNIDDSLQAPSEETKKEIIYLKRHLAGLSDESFKQSCAHNSLEPLKWREGMPMFDGVCYPSLLMRPNVNPSRGPHPRSVIAIDEGLNPMSTAVDLDANVIVGGYGLCDYIRNADRKMRLIQSKIDTRGNLLAKEDFDALAIILSTSASSKERNKASSKYDAKRALWIKHDPLCQYWKSQHANIKENKEQKCSVAREEFATFVYYISTWSVFLGAVTDAILLNCCGFYTSGIKDVRIMWRW